MFQELKFQLSTAILTILTLAAGVSAFINFQQQYRFRLPEDGVIWVDRQGAVEALYVKPGSPGQNAGIHQGDRLLESMAPPSNRPPMWPRSWYASVPGADTKYRHAKPRGGIDRHPGGRRAAARPRRRLPVPGGVSYLVIGLFVYFRRGSAQKARHFYILCLASFISLCFHYTGKLTASTR